MLKFQNFFLDKMILATAFGTVLIEMFTLESGELAYNDLLLCIILGMFYITSSSKDHLNSLTTKSSLFMRLLMMLLLMVVMVYLLKINDLLPV